MRLALHVAFAVLVAAMTISPGAALAAVIDRDFVPGSGDGLLTFDNVNRREWPDVTVFADKWSSEDAFFEAWEDPAFDFTQEFPELAPGGIYQGFALAGKEDVMSLAESAGIDTLTARFQTNGVAANRLVGLLAVTLDRFSDGGSSIGFIDEFIKWGFPPWEVRVQAE